MYSQVKVFIDNTNYWLEEQHSRMMQYSRRNFVIFTLNARGNSFMEVAESALELNRSMISKMISSMHEDLISQLEIKAIEYNSLKQALIPSRKPQELLLVFDTSLIDENRYGYYIFNEIIKTFDGVSKNSFLSGDYIDIIENQNLLKRILLEQIPGIRNFSQSNQFYMIYINNVSSSFKTRILNKVESITGFVGAVDLSNHSLLKDYVSHILVSVFLKSGKNILMGHEDDRSPLENVNLCGYPFVDHGFVVKSIHSYLYGVFLSYKIERTFLNDFKDIGFSINAISSEVKNINQLGIRVEESKMVYLKENKTDILKRLELLHVEPSLVEEIIKSKIQNNYIFNMELIEKCNVCKFNIILDFIIDFAEQRDIRVLVSLEYNSAKNELRLITMY